MKLRNYLWTHCPRVGFDWTERTWNTEWGREDCGVRGPDWSLLYLVVVGSAAAHWLGRSHVWDLGYRDSGRSAVQTGRQSRRKLVLKNLTCWSGEHSSWPGWRRLAATVLVEEWAGWVEAPRCRAVCWPAASPPPCRSRTGRASAAGPGGSPGPCWGWAGGTCHSSWRPTSTCPAPRHNSPE